MILSFATDSTFTNFELIPCTNDKDKRLIPSFALCDGHPYCMMGTDEQNCGTGKEFLS